MKNKKKIQIFRKNSELLAATTPNRVKFLFFVFFLGIFRTTSCLNFGKSKKKTSFVLVTSIFIILNNQRDHILYLNIAWLNFDIIIYISLTSLFSEERKRKKCKNYTYISRDISCRHNLYIFGDRRIECILSIFHYFSKKSSWKCLSMGSHANFLKNGNLFSICIVYFTLQTIKTISIYTIFDDSCHR